MDKSDNIVEAKLPPLRGLNDFALDSARFQLPNLNDLEKWNNRVVNNLLYYQTNYFLIYIIIFAIVGLSNPGQMIIGMIATTVVVMAFAYVSAEGRAIHSLKKKYPGAGIVLSLSAIGFLTYTVGSMLVFLLGLLLPFSVIFIHASLRLRNIKNKIVNKMEGIGFKRTPMGILLESLGMEPGVFD